MFIRGFGFPRPALAPDDAGGGGGEGEGGSLPGASVGGQHPGTGAEGGGEAGGAPAGDGQGGTPGAGGGDGGEGQGAAGGGMLGEALGGGQGEGTGEGEAEPGADDGRPTYTTTDENGNEVAKPIPDQFWDAENKQVRVDSLAKSFEDTKKAYDRLQQEKGQPQAPESADAYEVKVPEGVNAEDLDDDAVGVVKQAAHEAGLSQEQFEKFMGNFAQGLDGLDDGAPDPQEERAKLGDQADNILGATSQWINNLESYGVISEEHRQELAKIGSTAVGVKALDNLRRHYTGEQQIPVGSTGDTGLPSAEEVYAKVADPRYHSDPAFRKQVDKEFQQVFGDQPAGQSPNGLGLGVKG